MSEFIVVIPARYGSSRLPGKPLLALGDKPMIQHVVEAAQRSKAMRVVVATDHQEIVDIVSAIGAEAVMTREDHQSGTDRIAEVANGLNLPDDQVLVNVQGDEPDMPPALINQLAEALSNGENAHMATACTPIQNRLQLSDKNIVKVVRDKNQIALYFSRAMIPFDRDAAEEPNPNAFDGLSLAYRHLGIYAYRAAYVKLFSSRPPCALEAIEKLEQLRVLWHGERIICVDAVEVPGVGIDTPADLASAQKQFN